MMYALDASIGMKWVVQEPDSLQARGLMADYNAGLCELIAPDIFPVEIAHSLTRLERRGIIADAATLFGDVMANCPVLHVNVPLLGRAISIARQARISVYDCLYVALAEREGCDLVTADRRLINALQSRFPLV